MNGVHRMSVGVQNVSGCAEYEWYVQNVSGCAECEWGVQNVSGVYRM